MQDIFPYSDDYMRFDKGTYRYYLTEKALMANGTDLRARLTRRGGADPTAVINRVLNRTTEMIYNFIHGYAINNERQDFLVANIAAMRPIIQRALLEQAEYILLNGDLSRSVERDKRAIAIDETAQQTLDTVIPALGTSILYSGV